MPYGYIQTQIGQRKENENTISSLSSVIEGLSQFQRIKSSETVNPSLYSLKPLGLEDGIVPIPERNVIDITETSGTIHLDLSANSDYIVSINGNTTFVFDGKPPTNSYKFAIKITFTQSASATKPTITWPASISDIPDIDNTSGSIELLDIETLDSGTTWFVTNAEGILDANTLASLQSGLTAATTFIADLKNDPVGTLSALAVSINDAANSAVNAAIGTVNDTITAIENNIDFIKGYIGSNVEQFTSKVSSAAQNAINAAVATLNTTITGINTKISDIISYVGTGASQFAANVSSAVQSTVDTINNAITSAQRTISTITDIIGANIDDFKTKVSNAIQSTIDGIDNAIASTQTTVANIISYVGTGASQFATKVSSSLGTIWTTVQNWINNASTNVTNTVNAWWSVLTSGASSFRNAAESLLFGSLTPSAFAQTEADTKITEELSSTGSIGSSIISNVLQGFKGLANLLGPVVGTTLSQILSSIESHLVKSQNERTHTGRVGGGDIDMKTYDISRVDRIFFESNDGVEVNPTRPQISGDGDNFFIGIPEGKTFALHTYGQKLLLRYTSALDTGFTVHGNFGIYPPTSERKTPTLIGQFSADAQGNTLVGTTEGVKNLKDIGSGSGGSGANTSLSNLVSTLINQHLIPNTNRTKNIGSTIREWSNIHAQNLYLSNEILVAGRARLQGNTEIGNSTNDLLTITSSINSNLVPSTDNARDLGTSLKQWKNLHIDGTANIDSLKLNSGAAVSEFSTDDTLSGNSDNAVPTEQAVKAYVDNHGGGSLPSTITGDHTFSGDIDFSSNVNLGNTSNDTIYIKGRVGQAIVPSLDDNYNLGEANLQWRNLYVDRIAYIDNLILSAGAQITEFSTDGTLSGNSDSAVPTEKAVKTAIANAGGSSFNPSAITQSLIPSSNDALDFGSNSKRWRTLYLQDMLDIEEGYSTGFKPGGSTNDVKIFAVPKSNGKTELRASFQTGSSVIIATQP